MQKQTILVSGATGNLGSAVVEGFLSKGNKVIGLSHRIKEDPKEHPEYHEFAADLMKEDEAAKAVAISVNRYANIDTAVLTAGGFAGGSIESTTAPDLERYFMLNFETAYNLAKPLLRHMKENGKGKIFFIGSGTGMDTSKGKNAVAYSLSKSLLFQFAKIINADMDKTGVQAHVIVPSTIDTPQNRESMPNADFSKWEKPADIAKIIHKYANTENDINKTVIIIKEEL